MQFPRCPLDGGELHLLEEDPLVGTVLAERYLIEACIGEGGMGRVYRAKHTHVSRRFAVKVLFGELATDDNMRMRFHREAEIASRLSHPNVASVVDFGESERILYLAMDFVEGLTLHELIEREGQLDHRRVETLFRELCAGLSHAHERGLIHRDFKSENILISSGEGPESAKIVDFGIAFAIGEVDKRLTSEGMIIGTPGYMSPEQLMGNELDERTDLYSLGVVLYEMLAGLPPYEGDALTVARQTLAMAAPPVSERQRLRMPHPALETIASKLMEKRPENRFASAAEAAEALRFSVTPTENFATETMSPGELARYRTHESAVDSRVKRVALGLVALLTLLLTTIGAAVVLSREEAASREGIADAGDAGAVARSEAPVGPAIPDAATGAALEDERPGQDAGAGEDEATAVPAVLEADARPARPRRQSGKRRDRRKIAAKRGEAKAERETPSPAKEPPAPADLTRRYVKVGEALQALRQTHPEIAAELKARYSRIPLNDALRIPSLRSEVESRLRKLEIEIRQHRK